MEQSVECVQDGEKILFKTPIFDIIERFQKGRSGKMLPRFVVRNRGAVAILPVLEDGRILLIKQFRIAAKQYIYEIPAGVREPNEDVSVTAARELKEETGYQAKELVPIQSFYSSPGIFNERLHLFLATGLTAGEQELEDGEDLTVEYRTPDEIRGMIRRNEIVDGKTLVALLWYLAMK